MAALDVVAATCLLAKNKAYLGRTMVLVLGAESKGFTTRGNGVVAVCARVCRFDLSCFCPSETSASGGRAGGE